MPNNNNIVCECICPKTPGAQHYSGGISLRIRRTRIISDVTGFKYISSRQVVGTKNQ